jgi:hypothetical protein
LLIPFNLPAFRGGYIGVQHVSREVLGRNRQPTGCGGG